MRVLRPALKKEGGHVDDRRRRVDVPACDKPTQMGFGAPLHQGASHARQLHLHQRRVAIGSLFEQSSSAPKLEMATDHRTCGGSTGPLDRKHLLVQATELLPPMSAAEQRTRQQHERTGKILYFPTAILRGSLMWHRKLTAD